MKKTLKPCLNSLITEQWNWLATNKRLRTYRWFRHGCRTAQIARELVGYEGWLDVQRSTSTGTVIKRNPWAIDWPKRSIAYHAWIKDPWCWKVGPNDQHTLKGYHWDKNRSKQSSSCALLTTLARDSSLDSPRDGHRSTFEGRFAPSQIRKSTKSGCYDAYLCPSWNQTHLDQLERIP